METIVIYLIKSGLLLAVGVALFMLLMRNETFHRFNRWLLLVIALVSVLIPTVNFGVDTPMALFSSAIEQMIGGVSDVSDAVVGFEEPLMSSVVTDESHNGAHALWQYLLQLDTIAWVLILYFAVVALLVLRLLYMHIQIVNILHSGTREEAALHNIIDNDVRLVVHNNRYKPFCWFSWVAISRADLADCGREILAHESAHVHFKHSYDILFADLLIIIYWFNPMAWVMKSLLKDIHEYEADSAVLAAGVDAKSYQLLIIKKAVGARLYSIANSFNQSLTKKRIIMMCKEKSSLWQCAKALYILPLAVVAACTFSSPQNAADGNSEAVNNEVVNSEAVASDSNTEHVYQEVELKPEFPGGMKELMGYLSKNIKYPKESYQKNSQGKVFVRFVVKKDGSIDDIEIQRTSGDDLLDAEAMRVVKAMPAWVPGKQDGKNVNVQFILPVVFRLQGGNAPAAPSMNSNADSENSLPEVVTTTYANENSETIHNVVEQQPEFPGGMQELMKFLMDNIKYPEEALKANIQGKALVGFVINKDGSITDVGIYKSAGNDLLDAEAMRVVKAMPKWKPGMQKGKAVNVRFTLPVMFRLK